MHALYPLVDGVRRLGYTRQLADFSGDMGELGILHDPPRRIRG
jgi:hypothetical protein